MEFRSDETLRLHACAGIKASQAYLAWYAKYIAISTELTEEPMITINLEHTINLEQMRGFLARAVLTQGPNFIYNPGKRYDCYYVQYLDKDESISSDAPIRKTPCLIGVALQLAGINTSKLHGSIASNWLDWLRDGIVDITEEAVQYANHAQRSQDIGESWGAAYRQAELSLS